MTTAFSAKLKSGAAPLALGLALISASAHAQTAPTTGGDPKAQENQDPATTPIEGAQPQQTAPQGNTGADVVVTGSRIANPNLTSISPLTVVSGAEAKVQGTTRVEDLLNSLPQVTASQGSTDANGATGIATVNLRSLGPVRTLVLINGRRLVPGDPITPVSDLNFIPAPLIQRVDVLTGGASSVYGSDALAGVVNFILNKDFNGIQIDAQTSLYSHDNRSNNATLLTSLAARGYVPPRGQTFDGAGKQVSLIVGAGTDDGRGHVTAYATYRRVNSVTQGDRDYSYCGLTTSGTSVSCGGSSTSVTGRFRRTAVSANSLPGSPVYGGVGTSFTLDPGNPGTFRTFNSARDGFNFNPYNYFQRPDERYTLGGFAHFQISPAFDPYLEVMFMDDHTSAQIAPSGAFYGTDFFINCNNPLLSASQRTSLCGANAGTGALQSVYIGRRNVEGGPRVDDLRHTDYRITAGMKGDIAPGLSYDVYGQVGRAIFSERYQNDFSRTKLNRALNVVLNGNGQAVCASAIPNAQGQVVDADCVPYNIFSPNGVTQAAVNYLQTPGFQNGSTTEYVASGSISANLGEYGFQSPWAETGIGLAFGAEYRKEELELRHDIEYLTGDLAGQGTPFGVPDVIGSYDVKEGFAEVQVPLVSGKPFFDTLSLNASYRYSDYSLAGSTNAYKFGAEFAPIRQIRFRGTYNRAVRAPNILELFSAPTVGLFGTSSNDPCSGAAPTFTAAQCALQGVTAAQYGTIDASPALQYNQRTSGNANLKPEVADTYTAGVVLTPVRGLSISVDAYQIKIKKLIGTIGSQFAISQCGATGNPFFCSRINRAADGSLFTGNSFVDNPTENLGSIKTRGIDVNAAYRLDLSDVGVNNIGTVSFDLVGTYLDEYKIQPVGGANNVGSYNCEGQFGNVCGGAGLNGTAPLPKWRHKFRATFTMPNGISVSGAWRYFNHVRLESYDGNPLTANDLAVIPARLPSVSYFDLSVAGKMSDQFTVRVGAQNLLDKQPPISYTYSNNGSNTFAQTYDSLGRYLYASVTLDF